MFVRSSHSSRTPSLFSRAFTKRYIAVVRFGLFIQQVENALCARKPHDDGIELVGHLADVAGKLFGHIQEWDDNADAECKGRTG